MSFTDCGTEAIICVSFFIGVIATECKKRDATFFIFGASMEAFSSLMIIFDLLLFCLIQLCLFCHKYYS